MQTVNDHSPQGTVEQPQAEKTPPGPAPVHILPPSIPDLVTLVLIVSGVVVVAALYLAREVMIPITLAILLSFILAPAVGLLRNLHLPRLAAVLLSVVLALAVIGILGSVIGVQVASLAPDVPRYATTIGQKVTTVQNFSVGHLSHLVARLKERARRNGETQPAETKNAAPAGQPGQAPMPVEVHQPDPKPLEIAQRVLAPVLNPLETTLIVLIVSIFILLQREDLRDRLIRLFGARDLHKTTVALDEAAHRLSRYFLFQVAINAAFGLVISIGLFLIGVPSPVLWGILGSLLRFVPYIGSAIAAILPVILAAGADPGWMLALETAALFVFVETLTGQFLEPLIYGHSTGLSPAAVVISAIFWTWLWGPIGLILSTPLTLCLVVLARHVQRLEFLDVLLGDQPALTPVENFYQRLLAGDPDEAQDQAEHLLKEMSLGDYYDEIAVKGLQLAAGDAQRDVLTPDKLARVRDSAQELVADLGEYDAAQLPEPAATPSVDNGATGKVMAPATATGEPALAQQAKGAVLCIAGREPLDETVNAMLVGLLDKHGIITRGASSDKASRERIAFLNTEAIALVCVTSLAINGTPAHIRYLIRRLRARVGRNIPILVGLWPADEVPRTEACNF